MHPIFFILSTCVWENKWLLNKNYRDDLDIRDQGHSKGNIFQFCLYLGYPYASFKHILTTMMALLKATTKTECHLTLILYVNIII